MSQPDTVAIRTTVHDALRRHGRVVLAISGGLDSMTLLDAAANASQPGHLAVATFDHGTGDAATAAVALVRQRSAELGVECLAGRSTEPLSTEAAFRAARWRFLRETADRVGEGSAIVTAHTADDQVETVLMRLMRGAGARGLAGLYARSGVIRPLLGFWRRDLRRYAIGNDISWIEDPSNSEARFARNRLRRDLLPALRRVRPAIDAELLQTAREAARWRDDVDSYIDQVLDIRVCDDGRGLDVSAQAIAGYSAQKWGVLWPAIAARIGVTLDRRGTVRVAAFSVSARVGSKIQLAGGWQVIRSRDALQLRASNEPDDPAVSITERGGRWERWSFRPADASARDDAWSAWLPTRGMIVIRRWRSGDTMTPRAGGEPRAVKRLLSRAGVTGHDRARWPVVLVGDQIVWIPGVRRSDAATARPGRPGLPFVCEYHRP